MFDCIHVDDERLNMAASATILRIVRINKAKNRNGSENVYTFFAQLLSNCVNSWFPKKRRKKPKLDSGDTLIDGDGTYHDSENTPQSLNQMK